MWIAPHGYLQRAIEADSQASNLTHGDLSLTLAYTSHTTCKVSLDLWTQDVLSIALAHGHRALDLCTARL